MTPNINFLPQKAFKQTKGYTIEPRTLNKQNPCQPHYLTDTDDIDSASSGNNSENDEVNKLRR
jgi:hypothetical protein